MLWHTDKRRRKKGGIRSWQVVVSVCLGDVLVPGYVAFVSPTVCPSITRQWDAWLCVSPVNLLLNWKLCENWEEICFSYNIIKWNAHHIHHPKNVKSFAALKISNKICNCRTHQNWCEKLKKCHWSLLEAN